MRIGTTDPPVSHQTVKLARGKHPSSDHGVCVMELASMLAGEPFTDHPRSVCPVIGAFLRSYNDRLDERWRQDLYEFAAKVVGTRSTRAVERQRAQMCSEWARRVSARGGPLPKLMVQSHQAGRLRRWYQGCHRERAARRAALAFGGCKHSCRGRKLDHELHLAALRFLDELIAVDNREELDLHGLLAMTDRQAPLCRWEIDRDSDRQGGHDARQSVPDHN